MTAGIRADAAPAPGHGLANTRERLRTLYGDRASLAVTPRAPHGTVARQRVQYRPLPASSAPPRYPLASVQIAVRSPLSRSR